MFEANGIVYASNPTEEMRVSSVRGVGNACLVVTFDTGEDRLLTPPRNSLICRHLPLLPTPS